MSSPANSSSVSSPSEERPAATASDVAVSVRANSDPGSALVAAAASPVAAAAPGAVSPVSFKLASPPPFSFTSAESFKGPGDSPFTRLWAKRLGSNCEQATGDVPVPTPDPYLAHIVEISQPQKGWVGFAAWALYPLIAVFAVLFTEGSSISSLLTVRISGCTTANASIPSLDTCAKAVAQGCSGVPSSFMYTLTAPPQSIIQFVFFFLVGAAMMYFVFAYPHLQRKYALRLFTYHIYATHFRFVMGVILALMAMLVFIYIVSKAYIIAWAITRVRDQGFAPSVTCAGLGSVTMYLDLTPPPYSSCTDRACSLSFSAVISYVLACIVMLQAFAVQLSTAFWADSDLLGDISLRSVVRCKSKTCHFHHRDLSTKPSGTLIAQSIRSLGGAASETASPFYPKSFVRLYTLDLDDVYKSMYLELEALGADVSKLPRPVNWTVMRRFRGFLSTISPWSMWRFEDAEFSLIIGHMAWKVASKKSALNHLELSLKNAARGQYYPSNIHVEL